MVKMDGRDSAEYQIWEMKGHNGHLGNCLIHKRTKHVHDLLLQIKSEQKTWKGKKWRCSGCCFERILERESTSL